MISVTRFFFLNLILFSATLQAQNTFQKTYGGPHYDELQEVKQTSDGGYITIGTTQVYSLNDVRLFSLVIKTNFNGDTLWSKIYSESGIPVCRGYSIQETFDGGYIFSGFLNSNPFLLKIDTNGNPIWFKSYTGLLNCFKKIEQMQDSGFIVLGDVSDSALYLARINSQGNLIWAKSYSGNQLPWPSVDWHAGLCMTKTFDNGAIIGGYSAAFSPEEIDHSYSHHAYIVRVDSNGDTLWTKVFGNVPLGGSQEEITDIIETSDSGFILAGEPAFIMKINNNGDFLFANQYNSLINDVKELSGGGYIATGYSYDSTWHVNLLKTDASGNVISEANFGGPGSDVGKSIEQTTDGGFIIGADSYYSFDPDSGSYYLIKADSLGNSGCYQTVPLSSQTPYFLPEFRGPSTVTNINLVETNLVPEVGHGCNITIVCSSVGVEEKQIETSLKIYPNPATSDFTIQFNSQFQNSSIKIFNLLGEEVLNVEYKNPLTVDCEHFSPGLYFVKLQTEKGNEIQKLLVK